MSEEKKPRAPRRVPFQDELALHIRGASVQELEDLQRAIGTELSFRKMAERTKPGPKL